MSLFLTLNRFYTFFSVSFVGFEQENVCWVTILLKAHSQVWKFFTNWKLFSSDEKCFLFHLKKVFSFSRYLGFCVNRYLCFGHIWKRRKNDKANFEFYYVKTWLTYTHIAQFLKK